jgi:hypothetical protein
MALTTSSRYRLVTGAPSSWLRHQGWLVTGSGNVVSPLEVRVGSDSASCSASDSDFGQIRVGSDSDWDGYRLSDWGAPRVCSPSRSPRHATCVGWRGDRHGDEGRTPRQSAEGRLLPPEPVSADITTDRFAHARPASVSRIRSGDVPAAPEKEPDLGLSTNRRTAAATMPHALHLRCPGSGKAEMHPHCQG